jgi:hypothetical protein
MSDDPRPEVSPETTPPAQQAGIGKRRLLIKAALIGSTVPVVMTISRSALADNPPGCASILSSVGRSQGINGCAAAIPKASPPSH